MQLIEIISLDEGFLKFFVRVQTSNTLRLITNSFFFFFFFPVFFDVVQRLRAQGKSVLSSKLDSKTRALVSGISKLLEASQKNVSKDDVYDSLAAIQQAVNEIIEEVEDLPGVCFFFSFLFFSGLSFLTPWSFYSSPLSSGEPDRLTVSLRKTSPFRSFLRLWPIL